MTQAWQLVKFLVSITIGEDKAREELAGAFEMRQINPTEVIARRKEQVAQATEIGRDAHRLGRKDDLGPIPDSGTVIFTREGQEKVSFSKVLEDAAAMGFAITAAYVEHPRGKSYRFRVWFEKDGAPMTLDALRLKKLNEAFNRAYLNLYGFRNPDGSMTFNALNAMDVTARRGVRDLRIKGDGHVACELRDNA